MRESRQKKKKKTTKKTADMTEEEFQKLPESSWSRAVKNSCQSVIKNISGVNFSSAKVKLQHLIVSVAVETKTFSEAGYFKKKLAQCANIVNYILMKHRFVIKRAMKVYQMRALSDQTYNTFLNKILIENKDCQLEQPGKVDRDICS